MKTSKLLRQRVDSFNRVIHSCNLYLRSGVESIRVIDARQENGGLVVTALNSGKTLSIEQSLLIGFRLVNGRGEALSLSADGVLL